LITKETSQTLFAGLDLDIPIDDEDGDTLPKGFAGAGQFFSEKVKAEGALGDLMDAVEKGSPHNPTHTTTHPRCCAKECSYPIFK